MWLWFTVALSLAAPDGDGLALHMAAAERAAKAELDRDWPGAVAACQEAITTLPTGPRAARCERRVAWFDARRDLDGGFDLWTGLDTVRRETWRADPDGARVQVTALRDDAQATPLLRAEAGLWLANDALARKKDAALALTDTTPLYDARAGLDDEHRKTVVLTHALALVQVGRADEAKAVEKEALVAGGSLATPVDEALITQQRARVRRASWSALGLFVAASLWGAWRAVGQPKPWALLPMGVGLVGAYVIGTSWDAGSADAVLWMSAPLAGIHLLAGRAQHGTPSAVGRATIGLLAAVASFAAAWLAFDATGTLNQVWW
jgi:hypothetical protein